MLSNTSTDHANLPAFALLFESRALIVELLDRTVVFLEESLKMIHLFPLLSGFMFEVTCCLPCLLL
ncbi:hypothetical protein F2Q69_00046786 [Brassica cretica]|uniref:Uncharacterized protein n=1 Tax=Brassica cretica TaxID=69181 RepID=A0A8S9Q1I8_BRACR|nr:hypothetical protein F2Q69_00046786 [Brassica cretica]